MRRALPVLLLVIGALAIGAPVLGNPRVLLVAADEDVGMASVQTYLMEVGMFSTVDTFDAWHNTPTLDLLGNYCAVLVWSNTAFADAETLGNRLADYADSGGGVVLASMALMGGSAVQIEGRILDYSPLQPTYGNAFSVAELGWKMPYHSIMIGVDELEGYYRDRTELAPGAMLVAEWDDGLPLVAVGATLVHPNHVVAIALFPNDVTGIVSGDYARLFGNALLYTCPVPEPGMVALLGLSLAAVVALRRR
jgi:hypothetical protein